MTLIDVLNVGDGACSVIRCARCLWFDHSATIVDCGRWKGAQDAPAAIAATALGRSLAQIQRLVVTHFDTDHWGGLRVLAERYAAAGGGRNGVELIYPRLPDVAERLPAVVLGLITTAGETGVRATELTRAWTAVTRVKTTPVWEGDRFQAGHTCWEVLWPPRRLPANVEARIERALDETDRLAADLANEGYPALRNNLAEAYEVDGFLAGLKRIGTEREQLDAEHRPEESRLDWQWDETSESRRESDREGEAPAATEHSLEMIHLEKVPAELAKRFQAVAKKIAPINNLLSLTFHSVDPDIAGGVAVLGDLQGQPLQLVAKQMRPRYRAMLAPHHGTIKLPHPFPEADVCVSQAGERHYSNRDQHVSTHTNTICISTHDVGHVHLVAER